MSRARAAVVVLDACGAGALPDAADYGDAGPTRSGTSPRRRAGWSCPSLGRLGLGSIIPIVGVRAARSDPVVHGRLHRSGPGKDSTTGHWELMGVVPHRPLPTYPDGFPPEVVDALSDATGRGVLLQPALQRHRGDRRLRRAAPRDRRADPLHVGRLRAADRRARRRACRAPSCTRPARRRARS